MPVLLGQTSGQSTRITNGERSAPAPTPKVRRIHFYLCCKFNIPRENGIKIVNTIVLNSRWKSLSNMIPDRSAKHCNKFVLLALYKAWSYMGYAKYVYSEQNTKVALAE